MLVLVLILVRACMYVSVCYPPPKAPRRDEKEPKPNNRSCSKEGDRINIYKEEIFAHGWFMCYKTKEEDTKAKAAGLDSI